jgi:hypothetical protein
MIRWRHRRRKPPRPRSSSHCNRGGRDRKSQCRTAVVCRDAAIARQLQPSIPKAANLHLVTVSVHTNSLNGVSQTQKALNYEFGAASKWAVIQIVLKTAPGSPQVVGWHAAPYDHQPTTGGDFALSGKSVTSYLWLAAMALSTITIVSALILIARTKGIRRRWLWAVGSAVGFGQFTLNWSTGAWSFRPLGFPARQRGVKDLPFEAWMLSFSLPVVAVMPAAPQARWRSRTTRASTSPQRPEAGPALLAHAAGQPARRRPACAR